MLGFILSKMQMLLFAVGIFVVAVMFFNFISSLGLANSAKGITVLASQMIETQYNSGALCSNDSHTIPERLTYGIGSNLFFYDLVFSKVKIGNSNELILSVREHGKAQSISASSITMNAEIVLVDPGFISTDEPIVDAYVNPAGDSFVLYPRAAMKNAPIGPPNSFVALKEITNGKATVYIIPCTSISSGSAGYNNCTRNILKMGCYKLSKLNPIDTTLLPECFDVLRQSEGGEVKGFTWRQCKSELSYT